MYFNEAYGGDNIMRKVEPIRELEKIKEVKNVLLKRGFRDYMLFIIGINTGLRIGDILKLRVKDVKDKTYINLKEQKTSKEKKFKINQDLKKEIDRYTDKMEEDEFLFQSSKGINKPISRVQAHRILKSAAEEVGLKNISNHSMRKTFGYFYYKKYKEISYLQKIFNHSSPGVTLDYIGVNQDVIDKTIDNFYL